MGKPSNQVCLLDKTIQADYQQGVIMEKKGPLLALLIIPIAIIFGVLLYFFDDLADNFKSRNLQDNPVLDPNIQDIPVDSQTVTPAESTNIPLEIKSTAIAPSTHSMIVVTIILMVICALSIATIFYLYRLKSQEQDVEAIIEERAKKKAEREAAKQQAQLQEIAKGQSNLNTRLIVLGSTTVLAFFVGFTVRYRMKTARKVSGGLIFGIGIALCTVLVNIACWYEKFSSF